MNINSRISIKPWSDHNNQEVFLFKMENRSGAFVELTNYGAAVVSIVVPDKNGKLGNVILGFPNLQGYVHDNCYLGATVGRFANRIANARFSLDGNSYKLEANDNGNTNHSASAGFNFRVFDYEINGEELSFSLFSPHNDGGYPGNLDFKVCYRWTDENELLITYRAETDQKTIVNITNHCYFNLTAISGSIFDHELTISSNRIVEAGDDYIPTGNIIVTGELSLEKGLNVCYVLNDQLSKPAAVLKDPNSGRMLSIYTTYPGLMLYTGDYLSTDHPGHSGYKYKPFDGLCLECQYYPDSPNHPNFPSVILNPGALYEEHITYKFSTEP